MLGGINSQCDGLASHPGRGGVEILLVASCYYNRDKLWPDEPLGSYTDFTLNLLVVVKVIFVVTFPGETCLNLFNTPVEFPEKVS